VFFFTIACLFLLAIVFSVLLQFLFLIGIFKLFVHGNQ
jgi:hypothetical protein